MQEIQLTPTSYIVLGFIELGGETFGALVALGVGRSNKAALGAGVGLGGHLLRDLATGKEEVVVSNQGELSEGQAVKTTAIGW